jgi:hypothetical protein
MTGHVWQARLRVTRVPSALVVGVSYAAVLVAYLLGGEVAADRAAIAAPACVAGYAVLRVTRQWEVFALAVAPGAIAALLRDVVGLPRWTLWAIALVAVAALWIADRDEQRSDASARAM